VQKYIFLLKSYFPKDDLACFFSKSVRYADCKAVLRRTKNTTMDSNAILLRHIKIQ